MKAFYEKIININLKENDFERFSLLISLLSEYPMISASNYDENRDEDHHRSEFYNTVHMDVSIVHNSFMMISEIH